jgi:hypothetical protein
LKKKVFSVVRNNYYIKIWLLLVNLSKTNIETIDKGNKYKKSMDGNLNDVRNESVGNSFAVLLPTFSILCQTLFLISERPVDQQNDEEKDVQEGQDSVAKRRKTPRGRQHYFEDVVHVTSQSPKAAKQ